MTNNESAKEQTGSTPEKYTNLTYLESMADGNNEFLIEMISTFLNETPEAILLLEKQLVDKNWNLLRGIAHKMKPTLEFMGIQRLKNVILSTEKYAAEGIHLDQLPALIEQIKEICSKSFIELQEEINRLKR